MENAKTGGSKPFAHSPPILIYH